MESLGKRMQNNLVQFAVLLITAAAIVIVGLMGAWPLQTRWLIIMAVMFFFSVVVGFTRTTSLGTDGSIEQLGRWDGIFIDGRKKISLAYLQIILWTFIIFSAFATIVLHRTIPLLENRQSIFDWEENSVIDIITPNANIRQAQETAFLIELLIGKGIEELEGRYDALAVEIPPELWALLGISTASLVGAGLIKINKANTESSISIQTFKDELARAEETVKELEDQQKARIEQKEAVNLASQADSNLATITSEVAKFEQRLKEAETNLETLTNEGAEPSEIEVAQESLDQLKTQLANKTEQMNNASTELSKFNDQVNVAEVAIERLQTSLKNRGIDTVSSTGEKLTEQIGAAKSNLQALEQEQLQKEGSLQVNANIKDAKWSDIFSRELVGASKLTDVGKIQMFFLTIILILTYAAFLWAAMSNPLSEKALQILPTVTLPAITDSMLVLLGISHVGYLAVKGSG